MTNILVVEDDPFWQKIIRNNIARVQENCAISFVTSGADAMNLLDAGRDFSLVIADHFLEGEMTGHELWLSCQQNGIEVPFLLTSGNADLATDQFIGVRFLTTPSIGPELRAH